MFIANLQKPVAALRLERKVFSKQRRYLAPPEQSGSLEGLWFYKHFVPSGLKNRTTLLLCEL